MMLRLSLIVIDDDTDEQIVVVQNGSIASAHTVAEILRSAANQIDPPTPTDTWKPN